MKNHLFSIQKLKENLNTLISTDIKDISLGLLEYTHTFEIEITVGASNVDNSEKLAQEASRIFLASFLNMDIKTILHFFIIKSPLNCSTRYYSL